MHIRLAVLFLFFALSGPLYSQSYVTVSGMVMDSESNDPLVFASIGIRGKSIGTISNTIGEFDFHIPVDLQDDIMEINMLGYETFEMRVSRVMEEGITLFKMNRSSTVLDEVVITDTLNGGDIYSIALGRIQQNYPVNPFILDAFYRDIKSVGGKYVGLLEAAVKIYDQDYEVPRQTNRLREKVGLIEVRKSLGYDNKFTTFFDDTNLLEDLLLHNNVRYRQFLESEEFLDLLERRQMSFYDGRKIFIVQMRNSDRLTMYIDALTFAFIKIEYTLGPQNDVIQRRGGLKSQTHSLHKIVEFKEYAGRMHLSHIDVITQVNWMDTSTGELKFTTGLHQQLLINEVHANTSKDLDKMEPMKRYGLQYQQRKYNKSFWDSYNVIKDTPLDKKIVEDLERDISLDRQFQDN